MIKHFSLLALAVFLASSCGHSQRPSTLSQTPASSQTLKRAVFDLGSGGFRLKVAEVDSKLQKTIKIIPVPDALKQVKMDGASDLSKSSDVKFSVEYQTKAMQAIQDMMRAAKEAGAAEFRAVATGAFRKAKNANDFVKNIEQKTGLKVYIISTKQESSLGYYGGAAESQVDKANLLVWDIGGASMQFSYLNSRNSLEFYSGDMASVSFKELIISQVQKNNAKAKMTPNPIASPDAELALKHAEQIARSQTPQNIKDKLKNPSTIVVGIGGVHYYSVAGQLGGAKSYAYDDAFRILAKRLSESFNDDQLRTSLKTDYPETEVSNLILVSGFMRALDIKNVRVAKVDNTNGLLIAPETLFERNDIK